jgi:HAD superfamily hydrolase (TIGR01662 family)
MTEIIMLCGVPGSGKSFLTKEELTDADAIISRDKEGGHIADLVPKVEAAVSQGAKKIVLDCTFVTREHRDHFTTVAAKLDVPIHCWFFDTSKEVSQFNICWRMLQRYGKVLRTKEDYAEHKDDPNMFPPAVMFAMFKRLVKPEQSEGFASMRIIKPKLWKLPPEFKNPAVILDYDGTVRDTKSDDKYPKDPSDVEVFPEAAKKLQALAADNVILLGASNQSGVAKNDPPMKVAKACFDETNRQLGVDIPVDFDYSPAGPAAGWHRKPFPGMGLDAVWKYKLDPTKVTMVGDMTSDKTFAKRCGFNFEYAKDFFGLE